MDGKTLQEKLFLMQGLAPYMKKDSKAYNFNYVNEESVLAFVRPLLQEFGIQAYPEITEQHVERVETIVKGKVAVEFLFTGTGAIKLHDFITKETVEVPWVFTGSNSDPSQAFGSAMTYCMRYFWLKFLQIPTGNDDPDKWRSEDNRNTKREEQQKVGTENVPVESPKTNEKQTLTKAQLEEFGKLCEQEGGEAKTRLKKYVESMGYAKLSLVPQERFEELKDTFLSAGLPFSMED